ncbi:hypothetical protein ACROYT_G024441 [Oculina patagonica]
MEIATFRLHTASIHQAIRSTGCAKTYKARCRAVIGWFLTAVIGAFRSSLFLCPVVPSAVRCRTVLLLFFDRGHPCFRNFNSIIPVDIIRVKSYVNCLFDPAFVPVWVTINKLYLIPKRVVPGWLKITKTRKPITNAEPVTEFKSTAVLPYVKGLSEQLRCWLQQQGMRAVFKSETTLRSQLVRPKDAVDSTKQDGVVYRIPCECGKV